MIFSKPETLTVEQPSQPKEKAGGEIKQKIIEAKQKAEVKNSSSETVPTTTVEENTIPEPDADLQMLYSKINQANQEDTPTDPPSEPTV